MKTWNVQLGQFGSHTVRADGFSYDNQFVVFKINGESVFVAAATEVAIIELAQEQEPPTVKIAA